MSNIKFSLPLFAFLLIGFHLFAQPGDQEAVFIGKQKHIDQILKNSAAFSQYVMASDDEKIAACYTEDAKIFPGKMDIISGREPIRKYWEMPEDVKITLHKVTPREIKVTGNEAYDWGYYEGKTLNAEGEESSWGGKYVIIWRKVGKNWKIYLDIWNSL